MSSRWNKRDKVWSSSNTLLSNVFVAVALVVVCAPEYARIGRPTSQSWKAADEIQSVVNLVRDLTPFLFLISDQYDFTSCVR